MKLTHKHIIALQQIKNCGSVTVKSFATFAESNYKEPLVTEQDFMKFINHCIDNKIAKRLKLISMEETLNILDKANHIIEESKRLGIKIISFLDKSFPKSLLNTINEKGKSSVPIILYYKGDLNLTKKKGIAIIGTRNPTPEGEKAAKYLGEKLAKAEYNIVSGLAIGCDSFGHKGALNCDKGNTTAFLAHGLDSIYPKENKALADQITQNGGLLISEEPIGIKVDRYKLVARDRLQAALADATIVIQTGIKGGTMHAANTTLMAKKPLFCVKYNNPLLLNNEKLEGNKLLVKKGGIYLSSKNALEQIKSSLKDNYTQLPKQGKLFDNEF